MISSAAGFRIASDNRDNGPERDRFPPKSRPRIVGPSGVFDVGPVLRLLCEALLGEGGWIAALGREEAFNQFGDLSAHPQIKYCGVQRSLNELPLTPEGKWFARWRKSRITIAVRFRQHFGNSRDGSLHRLSVTVFSLVSPTLAGVGAVVALVSGVTSLAGILILAALGAFVAVPVSLLIARALS